MSQYLEYRDEKSAKFWTIEVQGNSHTVRYGRIGTDGRTSTKEFDSEEEAQKSADKLLQSKLKKGYQVASAPVQLPATPHEAVDLAVAHLTELHNAYPHANLIMELTTADEVDRLEHYPLDEKSFQWSRLGRWLELPELDEVPESSFDYMIERYGTLSWYLVEDVESEGAVYTFRSNGHAGPSSPLEILPAETYPLLEDIADYRDEPDYLKIQIFMSDEGCNGWAFDTRFATESGEYLIVWFEGSEDPDLEGQETDEIQPYGYWLLKEVTTLSEQLRPVLQQANQG